MTAHLVQTAPPLCDFAIRTLGRGTYLAVYSLISILLLVWLIAAACDVPTLLLRSPTPELAWVPFVLMPPTFILIVAMTRSLVTWIAERESVSSTSTGTTFLKGK